ncbi:Uncharacterised protein [Mycobacteroides abscessus subsp. massiliense]|nr:Uncharacterised protein [Mycobacteroides abscessus subsp. massiliense]
MVGEYVPREGLPLNRIGNVQLHRRCRVAVGADHGRGGLSRVKIHIGNDHVGTVFGESNGGGPADAAACTTTSWGSSLLSFTLVSYRTLSTRIGA